jgi:hypothetical protein
MTNANTDKYYLTHYIRQSCGWVKVAEYAISSDRQLANMKRALTGEATKEEVRLEVRAARAA